MDFIFRYLVSISSARYIWADLPKMTCIKIGTDCNQVLNCCVDDAKENTNVT